LLAPLGYAGDLPGRKNVVWLTQVCPLLAGLLPRFLSRANIAIYRRSFNLRDLQLVNAGIDHHRFPDPLSQRAHGQGRRRAGPQANDHSISYLHDGWIPPRPVSIDLEH